MKFSKAIVGFTTGELFFLAGIEKEKMKGGGKDEKVAQVEDALD